MAETTRPTTRQTVEKKQTSFTVLDYLKSKNGERHNVLPMNRKKKPAPVKE